MISFEKKNSDLPRPVAGEAEQNRFERIRKLAAEKHRKARGDGTPRPEVDRRRPVSLSPFPAPWRRVQTDGGIAIERPRLDASSHCRTLLASSPPNS